MFLFWNERKTTSYIFRIIVSHFDFSPICGHYMAIFLQPNLGIYELPILGVE